MVAKAAPQAVRRRWCSTVIAVTVSNFPSSRQSAHDVDMWASRAAPRFVAVSWLTRSARRDKGKLLTVTTGSCSSASWHMIGLIYLRSPLQSHHHHRNFGWRGPLPKNMKIWKIWKYEKYKNIKIQTTKKTNHIKHINICLLWATPANLICFFGAFLRSSFTERLGEMLRTPSQFSTTHLYFR